MKNSSPSAESSVSTSVKYRLCPDVVFLTVDGDIIAANVFARAHVEFNQGMLSIISFLAALHSQDEVERHIRTANPPPMVRDRTYFSCADGLLADPSNLLLKEGGGRALWSKTPEEIFALLIKRRILVGDEKQYLEYFKIKENLFDAAHFGNFHQQLGNELRVVRRLDPDEWWTKQKFKDGTRDLQDNLYKFVQLNFYEKVFDEKNLCGKRVLDVGCGTGFYACYLARKGALVTGIDPNPEHISKAKASAQKDGVKIDFRVVDIGSGDALEALQADSFDHIIFQDALMFYFIPYGNKKLTTRKKVLTELRRALADRGTFWVIEPHGVFWLQPWFGSLEHPFTILTEYQNKIYGVTPTLSQLSAALAEAGFLIKQIHEPGVSDAAKAFDPKAHAMSREFPLWWVFECVQ